MFLLNLKGQLARDPITPSSGLGRQALGEDVRRPEGPEQAKADHIR